MLLLNRDCIIWSLYKNPIFWFTANYAVTLDFQNVNYLCKSLRIWAANKNVDENLWVYLYNGFYAFAPKRYCTEEDCSTQLFF